MGVAVVLVLVGVVTWALVRGGAVGAPVDGGAQTERPGGSAAPGGREPSVEEPSADEPFDPADEDVVDAELARLRASDRYLALAEHERAREVEWPGGMVGSWRGFSRGGYANTEALWDEVVAPIRDDALLAGEPFTEPIWNENHPVSAYLGVGWSHEQTGRGDAFEFAFAFLDPVTNEPVERTHAVVIHTDGEGNGRVAARMTPFELRRQDASTFPEAAELQSDRVWAWVQEQPEVEQ